MSDGLRKRGVTFTPTKDDLVEEVDSQKDSVELRSPEKSEVASGGEETAKNFRALRDKLYTNIAHGTTTLSAFFRCVYCAPQVSILPVYTLLTIFSISYYEELGARLSYLAFFIALARSIDVLADPYVSHLSDSIRGQYGRRKPFMFIGCWLYALMLMLILSPPMGMSPFSTALWYGSSTVGFYLLSSFTIIPYDALGPELSSTYDDRTLLYYVASIFEITGGLVTMLLSQLFSTIPSNSECDYSKCYDSSGSVQGCLRNPKNGNAFSSFSLFNIYDAKTSSGAGSFINTTYSLICTYANGTSYANPDSYFLGGNDPASLCGSAYTINGVETRFPDVTPWTNGSIQVTNYTNYSHNERTMQCLYSYCSCVNECESLCELRATSRSYSSVGAVLSVWFIVSMILLCYVMKERAQLTESRTKLRDPQPPIAAMLCTMRNLAFTSLIPAFICDTMAYTLVTSLMLYFVRYVIKPEYQTQDEHGIECNSGYASYSGDDSSWRCSSNSVLGAILVTMTLSALTTGVFWYRATLKWGKRMMWIMWSALMVIALMLLFAVGDGQIDLAIGLSVIPGSVLGGRFLASAIVNDIIEYDEYLTGGTRNEATYVMFRNLLPKLCSIPASTIPIIILEYVGHQSPQDGRPLEQSDSVVWYVKIMIIVVPAILCIISMMIKTNYPLRYKQQLTLLADGIGLHMIGKASYDPITGEKYILYLKNVSAEDRVKIDIFDHFPHSRTAKDLLIALEKKNLLYAVAKIIALMRDRTAYAFLFTVAAIVGIAMTFRFFDTTSLTVVPLLCLITCSLGIAFTIAHIMRLQAAVKLKSDKYWLNGKLLDKVSKYREQIEKIANLTLADIVGVDLAQRRVDKMFKDIMATVGIKGANDQIIENAGTADDLLLAYESDEDVDAEHGATIDRGTWRTRHKQVVSHWKTIINESNRKKDSALQDIMQSRGGVNDEDSDDSNDGLLHVNTHNNGTSDDGAHKIRIKFQGSWRKLKSSVRAAVEAKIAREREALDKLSKGHHDTHHHHHVKHRHHHAAHVHLNSDKDGFFKNLAYLGDDIDHREIIESLRACKNVRTNWDMECLEFILRQTMILNSRTEEDVLADIKEAKRNKGEAITTLEDEWRRADLAYGNLQFNKKIEKVMLRRVRKAKRITEMKAEQLMQTNTTLTVEEAEAKAVHSVDYGDLHSEDGDSSQSDSESSYSDSESSKSTEQSEDSGSSSDSEQAREDGEEDEFEENVLASIKQENVHERRRLL